MCPLVFVCVCVFKRRDWRGGGFLLLLGDKAVNRVATEDVNQSLCSVMNAPVIMII